MRKLHMHTQISHFRIVMIIAIVDVEVESNRSRQWAFQFCTSELDGQILHLSVKGHHTQGGTIDIECTCHERKNRLQVFATRQIDTVEMLSVLVIEVCYRDVINPLVVIIAEEL